MVKQEPVIFLKPTSSYLENGGTIEIPHPLESLHHEVELAVVMGEKARDVPESTAMDYIGGRAVCFLWFDCRHFIFAYKYFLFLKDMPLLLI